MSLRVPRRLWALLVVILAVLLGLPITLGPHIKRHVLDAVGKRFDSDVHVDEIAIRVLPVPHLTGRGLVLRRHGETGGPPLITIAAFSADASLLGFLRTPVHISRVRLEGLEINVPPGGMHVGNDESDSPNPGHETTTSPLVVESLTSDNATLRILRREPGKDPRVFLIHQLSMSRVGADDAWPFRAVLTNPTPPGDIHAQGTFGPWNIAEPSETPLAADFRFDHADLGVFDGIQGTLDSTGAFKGVLERIDVAGKTHVPDFALKDVGHAVDLTTEFHSIVDGTNGNTWLRPVDAFFRHTAIHAVGGVVEKDGEHGRTVTLDVSMDRAPLEDALFLAVAGDRPPMTGVLSLTASLTLPPGHEDALQKIALDGTFRTTGARFAKRRTQANVDSFSSKARDDDDDDDAAPETVTLDFSGRFRVRRGTIHLSDVVCTMPGARVSLGGDYVMKTGALDLGGTVRLDAKLSSMTTGMKSMVLHLFDGLFRHQDVTVIPITIGGVAKDPSVKLDFGRLVRGG